MGGTGMGAARADLRVLRFEITGGKIREVEVIADPERLRKLDLAVINGG